MKRLAIALLTIAVLLGGAAFFYSFPDHRYRLTIEIDTPDGVKSGSSVIAVYASDVRWGYRKLIRAILAMDVYNRGYNQKGLRGQLPLRTDSF